MSSSSHYDKYFAFYGRLNGSRGRGGWCARTKNDRGDHLQIDMGEVHSICAVATQGKLTGSYITSYKLYFSIDGVNWMVYTEFNKMKVKKKHLTDFTITENETTQYEVQTPCTTCFVENTGGKKNHRTDLKEKYLTLPLAYFTRSR